MCGKLERSLAIFSLPETIQSLNHWIQSMLEAISLLIVLQSYFFCALVQPYRYNHFKDYSIQCLLSITTIHFQGIDFFTFVHPHSSQVSKYESKLYSMPFQRHN